MNAMGRNPALEKHRLPGESLLVKEEVKGKVSQTVADRFFLVDLDPLNRMGMVTQDEVGAGVDGLMGDALLMQRDGIGAALGNAPVNGNREKIDLFPPFLDILTQSLDILLVGMIRPEERGDPDRGQARLPLGPPEIPAGR